MSLLTPRFDNRSRAFGDLLCSLTAFLGALVIRVELPLPFTEALLPSDRWPLVAAVWWVPLLLQPLTLYMFGLYDPPQPQARSELLRRLSASVVVGAMVFAGFIFFTDRTFPRSVVALYGLADLALLFVWRHGLQRFERVAERRVALVGRGPDARELARSIETHHWHGLRVAGHVPAPGETETSQAPEGVDALGPQLGEIDDLPRLLADDIIDDVIVAAPAEGWRTRLVDRLSGIRRPLGASVLVLPGPWESLLGRTHYRWVRDLPLIEVVGESSRRVAPLQRGFDILAALLLLVSSSPILLGALFATRATSSGPLLYRQRRVGRDQIPFTLVKLRTMVVGAESAGEEVLAAAGDPRTTPVGAWLRQLRIDELPQLWNVLRGEMSLVGPRPERPGFVERYLAEVPGYAERFRVRPGLTGLAQVNGDYHSSPANKLRYDLAYIANAGPWLDLSILIRTVKIVLTSRGV